jgi:hypothetical protein
MLRALITRSAAALRDESGVTLIELLTVIAIGIVIMSALFTILDVTLHQTSRQLTRVAATQRARTTFESIENELHSACIASGEAPIQPSTLATGGANGSIASDASNLVFVSQYGTAVSPTPVEHRIAFDSSTGTLKEYTYSVSGSSPSNWTFATTPTSGTTKTLLNNVKQATDSSGTAIPVFQYFAYEPYVDVNGNTDMMLMDGTTPVPGTASVPNPDPLDTSAPGLSTDDAGSTAEVVITLKVGSDVNSSGLNNGIDATWVTVSDSVVLRFVTTPNQLGSNATFGPCA